MTFSSDHTRFSQSGSFSPAKRWSHIVIGGGTAGSKIAISLALMQENRVLLIEAGQPQAQAPTPPIGYPSLFGSEWDWGFRSQPQPELGGRKLGIPRGKGLGGSSLINAMIAIGGDRSDWERWGSTISPWLSFDSIMNAIRRSGDPKIAESVHPVFLPERIHPLSQAFIEAIQTKCGSEVDPRDYQRMFSGDILGPTLFPVSIQTGKRIDSWEFHHSQAAPSLSSESLQILTGHHVSRLIIDQEKCVALELQTPSGTEIVSIDAEVILCCGAIGTPTLLLRSGIGPKAVLDAAGIATQIASEGIGENLHDQPLMPVIFQSNIPSLSKDSPEERSSNIAEVGVFLRYFDSKQLAKSLERGPDSPDLQVHFTPTHYLEYPLREQPTDAFTLGMTLLHPQSRGRLWIESADPTQPPLIDLGFLNEQDDFEKLIDSVEVAREIAASSPLNQFILEELIPGSGRKTRSQIARSVRAYTQSIYHPIGTCRMGQGSDAPVSPDLRLRGTCNIRIIDASVLPDQPSCNPAAVLSMLTAAALVHFYQEKAPLQ